MAGQNYYNKRKILNDPIYGFISLPSDLVFDLIEHPYFQRLRRIKQLGLTHLVYPGGLHTRFHHALGAMHLMRLAIEELRFKGHKITEEEAEGVTIAILLHDIGHGPFSHALEHTIIDGISHEEISEFIMSKLNEQFGGKLSLAIKIFKDQYKKRFLHQLVSSQLDMDRIDYLKRDSFYTGVSEGVISTDRIIKMLNIVDDELVIEEKGIYSIEKFIIARRLMYWQVYLHKTAISAEILLINIIERAKEIAAKGGELFATKAFRKFLYGSIDKKTFTTDPDALACFSQLDDTDVMASIKMWVDHEDKILSELCQRMVNRKLFKVEIQNKPFEKGYIEQLKKKVQAHYGISSKEAKFYVLNDHITNNAYNPKRDKIGVLLKSGKVVNVTEVANQISVSALSKEEKKYYVCYPKEVG